MYMWWISLPYVTDIACNDGFAYAEAESQLEVKCSQDGSYI